MDKQWNPCCIAQRMISSPLMREHGWRTRWEKESVCVCVCVCVSRLWHSAIQVLAYTTAPVMQDLSHVCNLRHSNTWSLTHWTSPGMDSTSSWILVGNLQSHNRNSQTIFIFNLIIQIMKNMRREWEKRKSLFSLLICTYLSSIIFKL